MLAVFLDKSSALRRVSILKSSLPLPYTFATAFISHILAKKEDRSSMNSLQV
jgi:hypothetical protein